MDRTATMGSLMLGFLLVIGTIGADAGMYQDFQAKSSSASTMSYPYGDSEVVELVVDNFSNCAQAGEEITFAETQLVCAGRYGAQYTSPGRATSDPAATCEWHWVFFSYPGSLPVTGTTQTRYGKLFGNCVLADAVDHCSHGLDCAGMTIAIEAWVLDVPAWFRTNTDPTLINDGGLTNPCSGASVPSCCVLAGDVFGFPDVCMGVSGNRCPDFGSKTGKGNKQADAGTGTPATSDNKTPSEGVSKRQKRIQPADSLADGSKKPAAMASTSSMGGNGDYYRGHAYVAVGSFIIEDAHHNHKWESKGKMSWVIGTSSSEGPIQGPPPENLNLFEAEANKLHLKFFKASDYGYGYPKSGDYGYEHPKHYDDGPKPYDKYDGPKHYDEPKPYDDGPKRYDEGPHERRRRRF